MIDTKIRLGVIFGGRSGEHEVSLMSADSVIQSLNAERYQVVQIGITRQGAWLTGPDALQALQNNQLDDLSAVTLLPDPTRPGLRMLRQNEQNERMALLAPLDVVFPVLHGTFGEDGTLQGLFEMADLAYVGAGVLGSAVGMDKGVFKDVMRAQQIPVVQDTMALRSEIENQPAQVIARCQKMAPYPLFVKPANLGSSVGVSKAHNKQELLDALQLAAHYDRRVVIEQGVNAREIEVSVLGNDQPQASLAGEILPAEEFYTYQAKYHDDRSQELIPAAISEVQMEDIRAMAVRAYQAIDCAGLARVDFLLERDTGKVYLNEINTLPGFTQISMYPKLWAASGLAYAELLDRLIELALERKAQRDRTVRTFEVDGM